MEEEYPNYYHQTISKSSDDLAIDTTEPKTKQSVEQPNTEKPLSEGHYVISDGRKRICYDKLLGAYIKGASYCFKGAQIIKMISA